MKFYILLHTVRNFVHSVLSNTNLLSNHFCCKLTQFSVDKILISKWVSGRINIRYVGINAGDGNPATKKELEGERQAGAFSIEEILGSCRKESGRRGEVLPTLSPFLPPPLPSHLPPPPPTHLPPFYPLPPIFPFLPFAFNSETRRSSSPAQKKVGLLLINFSA